MPLWDSLYWIVQQLITLSSQEKSFFIPLEAGRDYELSALSYYCIAFVLKKQRVS
jgi:hypothetical protein